ncbi:hypothetical protein ACFX1T_021349 [Malus domestica]
MKSLCCVPELIATTRPFLRTVCALDIAWVTPILGKVNNLVIKKLSGRIGHIEEQLEGNLSDLPKKVDVAAVPDDRESIIQAARKRLRARKEKK